MEIVHINPETMYRSPAFSQGVMVVNPGRLLVIGGQNGIDATGQLAGDDIRSQTRQAVQNLLTVLQAAGGSQEHVIRMTVYLTPGQSIQDGFAASQEIWGQHATAISVVYVAALGRPGVLVEIEALAALP